MKLRTVATRMLVCTVIAAAIMAWAASLSPATAAKKVPRAVTIARTTVIPNCTTFVDAAFAGTSNGTATRPFKTIAAAIVAAPQGAVICVAEGAYPERLLPGIKPLTLAGGFQSGKAFKLRDSAKFASRAIGNGSGSFLRIDDPGPSGTQLTAVDGFEISGYSQAVVRDFFLSQRFDLTNNFIHDNVCAAGGLNGAGFALANVSGSIRNNVIARNRCDRGGAGFLIDATNENTVTISGNLIDGNAGTEPSSSHGGGLYLFTNKLSLTANTFTGNEATGWGGGLYIGAFIGGGQPTSARLAWNVYRGNRAGLSGGGLFCDDGAKCQSEHEIFDGNCGGNIYLDSGPGTTGRFDHLTAVNAKTPDCSAPGAGVQIDADNPQSESYSFVNAIFWGNATGQDFVASCNAGCTGATISVSYSMVQKNFVNNGLPITFGKGILTPSNPRFVGEAKSDFHLKSIFGHWTRTGPVADSVSSKALAKGDPSTAVDNNPPRAGNRTELGAYGDSAEASYMR